MQDFVQNNYLTSKDKSQSLFVNVAAYSCCVLNKSVHISFLAKTKELIYLYGADEE